MHLTDINFAVQFNESNKKKKEKKRKKRTIALLHRVYFAFSISFLLSLFLPSQGITEKTMAQAFRRFPIISISLKYLRVWQKETSFRVDRDLFRSLSNASLTMDSALLFVFSTYLTAARLLVFLSHFAPTSAGILSRHKRSAVSYHIASFSTFETWYENVHRPSQIFPNNRDQLTLS